MRSSLPIALALAAASLCAACDPVYSLELRVIATSAAQALSPKPSQVMLREHQYDPDAGEARDKRLMVICGDSGQDMQATLSFGGVCGSAMDFTAYVVPIEQDEADRLGCGVLDPPALATVPLDISAASFTTSGTAFGDVGPEDCAEGDAVLTLRLEPAE